MNTLWDDIHIFATNIRTPDDIALVGTVLAEDSVIRHWSIDQEDVDCVLRVVSPVLRPTDIINIIKTLGFDCRELD